MSARPRGCSGEASPLSSSSIESWRSARKGLRRWTWIPPGATELPTAFKRSRSCGSTPRNGEISPDRVGFLGFSAGAMVASGALLQKDSAGRPNFVALVYGAPLGAMPEIPAKLPPMFMAWAQDDQVALEPVVKFRDALVAAGQKPEIHVFSAGGHGFGTRKHGTSSDHWMDELYFWLTAQGFLRRVGG